MEMKYSTVKIPGLIGARDFDGSQLVQHSNGFTSPLLMQKASLYEAYYNSGYSAVLLRGPHGGLSPYEETPAFSPPAQTAYCRSRGAADQLSHAFRIY